MTRILRPFAYILAIIMAWKRHKHADSPELVQEEWVIRHFPPNLFFVRPLSPQERVLSKYDGDGFEVWHAVCHPVTGEPVIVSDDIEVILNVASKQGLEIARCH